MRFLLDTSVAIPLRDLDPPTQARVRGLDGSMALSIVSRIELEGGVLRDPKVASLRRLQLDEMLSYMPVLDFDAECADAYRAIVEATGYSRRKLLDRMIAAQAMVHHATLVTLNAADFRDAPGLQVLAW